MTLKNPTADVAVQIDLDEVKKDWLISCGPYHIRDIANHYSVYEHLFGAAYFVPRIPLNIHVCIQCCFLVSNLLSNRCNVYSTTFHRTIFCRCIVATLSNQAMRQKSQPYNSISNRT